MSVPGALAATYEDHPIHVMTIAADREVLSPDHHERSQDAEQEAARLYHTLRRVPGITARLRIVHGGHQWATWEPALEDALGSLLRDRTLAGGRP